MLTRPPPRNIDSNPCTVQRMHHVGIAVRHLEEAVAHWQAVFGVRQAPIMESPERGIRAAVIDAGGTNIEFLQPMIEDHPFAAFLAEHGEGLHHVCFAVESVTAARDHLNSQGVQLTNEAPIAGFNGHFIFTDPASTNGVRIELSELYPEKLDT